VEVKENVNVVFLLMCNYLFHISFNISYGCRYWSWTSI